MTEQELKNLSRRDLLEMLIEQSKEVQDLKSKLAQTESLLQDKTAMLEQMEQMNKAAAEITKAVTILKENYGICKQIERKSSKDKPQDSLDSQRLQQEIARINAEKVRMKELRELKSKQNKLEHPKTEIQIAKNLAENEINSVDLKVENYGDDGKDGRKENAGT